MNKDIIDIITASAAMGAAEVIRQLRPADDRISQRQAFRDYGRAFVESHANQLSTYANGNRKMFSRAELERIKAAKSVAVSAMRIEFSLK